MANIHASKAALRDATQGVFQADTGALTSAAAAGGTPTKTEFDKVVADLATLRTAQNALLTKLRNAGLLASS
jgi:hypothetical protein